jgi:hypothetical protein
VRECQEDEDLQNTSWALVTMGSVDAAARALRGDWLHTPLLLHDFEQTTADKGTGHMADIMNLQVSSISMRTSAHRCC